MHPHSDFTSELNASKSYSYILNRINPSRLHLIPSWDLCVVLAGLQKAPFELHESAKLKILSLKTALLTVLTSIKVVGDYAQFGLCPVCALHIYMECTRSFRSSDHLFVWFGGQWKGKAVSKLRLAHWLVDTITLEYHTQGKLCPLGVRAHSTLSMASSCVLVHSFSVASICRAVGWVATNTFARFDKRFEWNQFISLSWV